MLSFFDNNHFDKFILCGSSEIGLYELKEKSQETEFIYDIPKVHNISEFSYQLKIYLPSLFCFLLDNVRFVSQLDNSIVYLNSEKRYQYIKCAAPSHHIDEMLVACGQASGKVSIINFNPTSDNYLEFSKFKVLLFSKGINN